MRSLRLDLWLGCFIIDQTALGGELEAKHHAISAEGQQSDLAPKTVLLHRCEPVLFRLHRLRAQLGNPSSMQYGAVRNDSIPEATQGGPI